ncbi:MAG: hypothetical protein CBC12_11875 [Candidatus Puniceispirillum sp. TMED52]|nr:MAG: hypothetical protein CBC12_11875 [Candidatus Puniceispirillum sp. TMED52]
MSSIIIPSSEADRKRIKDAMQEISNSFLRQEAEREFVKEALISLEDDIGIPKKYLSKMARIYHKQNMSEIMSEIEEIEALLETVNNA